MLKLKEKQGNLLVVDDEQEVLKSLKRKFRKSYNVYLADSAEDAYQVMQTQDIHVVISDQRMPKITGTEFFKKIKLDYPDVIRLILTAYTDINAVIVAVNEGSIFHYLTKPWDPVTLETVVEKAFEQYWLVYNNKMLMAELQRTNAKLQREMEERKQSEIAKAAAEAASEAKSAFLANMSHELRTPLNAILGYTQIMMYSDPDISSENAEYLKTIEQSGKHLLSLINQVLDLSKIESGRATVNLTKINLHNMVKELHDMFLLIAVEKGLQFELSYEPNVPTYIFVDGVKLRQVLINLLSNALKFTQSGGVSLSIKNISNEHVEVELGSSLYSYQRIPLQFTVVDSGPGIAPEEMDYLFEAFVQTKIGRKEEGTGLGLTISKKLVELMGGELTVTSVPASQINSVSSSHNGQANLNSGTTFTFTITVNYSL